MWIGDEPPGGNGIAVRRPSTRDAAGLEAIRELLAREHLAPLIDAVTAATKRPRSALWRSADDRLAAAIAWVAEMTGSSARAIELLEGKAELRTLDLGTHDMLLHVREGCCLYYRTPVAVEVLLLPAARRRRPPPARRRRRVTRHFESVRRRVTAVPPVGRSSRFTRTERRPAISERPSFDSDSFSAAVLPAATEYLTVPVSETMRLARLPSLTFDAVRNLTVPLHALAPVQRTDTATRRDATFSFVERTESFGAGAGAGFGTTVATGAAGAVGTGVVVAIGGGVGGAAGRRKRANG